MDLSVNFTEISATIISRSFDIETCNKPKISMYSIWIF